MPLLNDIQVAHTLLDKGVRFMELGETERARLFLESVHEMYPTLAAAREAGLLLEQLDLGEQLVANPSSRVAHRSIA